jgi:hypothetical protein
MFPRINSLGLPLAIGGNPVSRGGVDITSMMHH